MTPEDTLLKEQLSAWMDGELPDDQARFLQRRLDGDAALRAQWERWQLASACVRGQPLRRMPPALREKIAEAVAGERRPARAWPWIASAAAAVLVFALVPGALVEPPEPGTGSQLAGTAPAAPASREQAATAAPSPLQSPASVRDFPLVVRDQAPPWPRSPVATGDRSLEGYLVRHNALMAEDGLGGFMPYVDVVAHDPEPGVAGDEAGTDQP